MNQQMSHIVSHFLFFISETSDEGVSFEISSSAAESAQDFLDFLINCKNPT